MSTPALVTQEMIDALTKAIADGVRQVSVPGLTTTYQTTASMMEALAMLQRMYAAQQASGSLTPPSRVTFLTSSRGYD